MQRVPPYVSEHVMAFVHQRERNHFISIATKLEKDDAPTQVELHSAIILQENAADKLHETLEYKNKQSSLKDRRTLTEKKIRLKKRFFRATQTKQNQNATLCYDVPVRNQYGYVSLNWFFWKFIHDFGRSEATATVEHIKWLIGGTVAEVPHNATSKLSGSSNCCDRIKSS